MPAAWFARIGVGAPGPVRCSFQAGPQDVALSLSGKSAGCAAPPADDE